MRKTALVVFLCLAFCVPAWASKSKKPVPLPGPHVLAAPIAAEWSGDGKRWKRVTGNLKLPARGWLRTHAHDSVQFDLAGARVTLFSRSLIEWKSPGLELLFGEARVQYHDVDLRGASLKWISHALDWTMRQASVHEKLKQVALDPVDALWVSAPDRATFQSRLAGERGEVPVAAAKSKKAWDRAVYVLKGTLVGFSPQAPLNRSTLGAGEAWISEQGDLPGTIRKVEASEIRATLDAL